MWIRSQLHLGGVVRFFYISLGDGGLKEYYSLNFALLYHHKIDFRIFEDMMPWERSVYIKMLTNKVKEEAEINQLKEIERKAKRKRR